MILTAYCKFGQLLPVVISINDHRSLTTASSGDKSFLQALEPAADRAVINRGTDAHDSAAENRLVQLECGLDLRTGQLSDACQQRVAFLLAEFTRGDNLRLANPLSRLQLRVIGGDDFMHMGDAIVVDEHGDQVAQLAHHAEFRVQLVEDFHLLQRGNCRVDKDFAQFPAAIPGAQKVGELLVDGRDIELCGRDHVSEGAGVMGDECCHLLVPSMDGTVGGLAHKFGDEITVGFGREDNLLRGLLDGEVSGEVAESAARLCSGYGDLLLGRSNNPCALFFNGGLDALLVLLALPLYLRVDLGNLFVEPGELRFNGAEARVGVDSSLPGHFEVVAQGLRTLADYTRQNLGERDDHDQRDDGEVDPLEQTSRGLNIQMKDPGKGLDDRGVPVDVVFVGLFLLDLAG